MPERTVSGASLTPDNAVAQAAERLTLAAWTGVPTSPVRDVLGSTDVTLAYQVQNALTAARKAAGARVVGRKVGLTSCDYPAPFRRRRFRRFPPLVEPRPRYLHPPAHFHD
jgi:hypothetical protein